MIQFLVLDLQEAPNMGISVSATLSLPGCQSSKSLKNGMVKMQDKKTG